ncbi:MAG: NAD(P)H-dependent oxidoreductase [Zunongwangia sp.]|jgi:nitroreductase|uniref:Nitroreductase n=3 Tax=Zunongwangia profunda TaxID=398743 RepID=D5BG72_ZUNPS|nr:NAD(P)H-dependent oxidoreductase [Zunongwangia profunda]MAG88376.1 NAD(P)H-dependent oxidoreductase [Flavobacteriaceae bacterium]MAO35973.1 NAD(P)H-dependent oxidoreductase [Zunongwangia sp.]ADF53185.1 nitroreductase [Zunongwangia profunda SM-A87]MAO38075.1 NAD(P)H-dependent oxidoreductase [Zunongwangia sp.]MAS69468.1 NAD(P)H-dependent oxidoreductase [Zunongwangia sp.]|tara:strand:+ start:4963 stop:5595 length:633 start_codon:yes stop_codon:yes gene_type:complete
MSNIKALQWRYAVKKFDEKKILPESKVDILKQAFNLTATSYGLQPIRLVVVKNKELQESLKEKAMNQVQLSTASHVLVICIEDNVDKEFILNYFERVKQIRETPDEILDPFKNFLLEDFGNKSNEELAIWAKNQAYLVLGTLLTVCATEEIDACPMEGFLPEAYDELLNLKEKNLKSVLVLPVGYRAKDDIFSSFKKVRRAEEDAIINIY